MIKIVMNLFKKILIKLKNQIQRILIRKIYLRFLKIKMKKFKKVIKIIKR